MRSLQQDQATPNFIHTLGASLDIPPKQTEHKTLYLT